MADNPVGVDIEKVKPHKKYIIERFFTQIESDYIFENIKSRDERFAEIWTKKEAYVKYKGKGMAMSFDLFDVISEVNSLLQTVKINDYLISVCFAGNNNPKIIYKNLKN